MNTTLISVNMVVYNCDKYIKYAIDSILDQTYKKFELIIINDASTDLTQDIIKSYSDPRIKYFRNNKNMGECISRKIALQKSSGDYIAVMDADDISLPSRLEEQICFLENNLDFGLVGSIAEIINSDNNLIGTNQSLVSSPERLKVQLFFSNCFTHSSIMFRKKYVLKVGINKNRSIGVDYEMLVKISRISKIYNLNKVLVQYRKHEDSILSVNYKKIEMNIKSILLGQIKELGIQPTENELDIHYKIKKKKIHKVNKEFFKKLLWLEKIYYKNNKYKIFDKNELFKYVSSYWLNLINNPEKHNFRLLVYCYSSRFYGQLNISIRKKLIFLIKCIINFSI